MRRSPGPARQALSLALTACLLLSMARPAAAAVIPELALLPERLVEPVRAFSTWASAQGREAAFAVDPALGSLHVEGEAGLAAAEPLLRLALGRYASDEEKAAFLARLRGVAGLTQAEQAALAGELSQARQAAAEDVGEKLSRLAEVLRSGGDEGLEQLSAAWPRWQGLGLYGEAAARTLSEASTRLAERRAAKAMAVARQPYDVERVKRRLEAGDLAAAGELLGRASPVDVASRWDDLTVGQRKLAFRLIPRPRARQAFEQLEAPHQRELLESLEHEHVQDLVQGLDPVVVGQVARDLPAALVQRLLSVVKLGDRESIQRYTQFPDKTVGALMRGRYVTLEPQWTAKQALERVRFSVRLRHVEETHLDSLIVVDAEQRLLGLVGLKALVAAAGDMRVADLMDAAPQVLSPGMDQEEAVQIFTRHRLKSAPVIERSGKVLGVVAIREVLGAAKEETDEDFAKISGGLETSLLAKSPFAIAAMRLPWLIATCFGELLVASLVKHFEPVLVHIVALAAFMPLISAMGGNSGSQTATVVVRGLATGEVAAAGARRIITKEIKAGALLGLTYGVFIGIAAYWLYGSLHGVIFAIVVGAAMAASMVTAATAGALEPFLFKKLGIDPATATGPLITTFTDLVSTLVYFSLATVFLLHGLP